MNVRGSSLHVLALVSLLVLASGCNPKPSQPTEKSGTVTEPSAQTQPVQPDPTPAQPQEVTGAGGPQKPPIIIDPGDGGAWTILNEPAVSDSAMTGNKLNECAFGSKQKFIAIVQTSTNPNREVDLVAAVGTFGGKTLDISVDGNGQFVWRLDNTVLVPYKPTAMARWRSDLMTEPSWMQIASFEELSQPYTILGVGMQATGNCMGP